MPFNWHPWMGYALALAAVLLVVLAVLYAGRLRSDGEEVKRRRLDLTPDARRPLPAPLTGPSGRCTLVESRHRGRLFLVGESVTANGHKSLREVQYFVSVSPYRGLFQWCARAEGVPLAPYHGTAESLEHAISDAHETLKDALGAIDECELDAGEKF